MTDLADRWPHALADRTDLRDSLLEEYGAPHRRYHDLRHLSEVLDHIGRLLAETALSRDAQEAVVLAAWFHDAVYEGRPDDVERSAEIAERHLAGAGLPRAQVGEVVRLVRLTLHHRPDEHDVAGQVLCDADLAILAAGPERYADYVAGVRQEYAHLDEATFRAGRAEVLRALLEKPRLFHTSAGHGWWEDAARANVARELSSPGPA